jgi:RND family efflux transporter MFP subunit
MNRNCWSTAIIALTVVASFVACGRGGRDADDKPKPTASTSRPSRTADGDPIVRLDHDAQARIGLQLRALTTETVQPELVAYGRLEEDPSRVFVLRASVSGTLRTNGRPWPRIGESVNANSTVGLLEPRLAPADQISLTNQLATARAERTAATSSVATANAAYERARILNDDNKNVSDRALEEAQSRLASEKARLQTAADTVALLERSLRGSGPANSHELVLERSGEVTEVSAQPGEAVEAGAPILRVASFDQLLARINLPVGEQVPSTSSAARIVVTGYEQVPITAERVSISTATQPGALTQSVLFRFRNTTTGLRPGPAAAAHIPVAGVAHAGVVIPASAIVRTGGQAFAYVQVADGQFVRKSVPLDQPTVDGYVTTTGFAAGDRIVVQGAQMLLTEEFKSRLAEEG